MTLTTKYGPKIVLFIAKAFKVFTTDSEIVENYMIFHNKFVFFMCSEIDPDISDYCVFPLFGRIIVFVR